MQKTGLGVGRVLDYGCLGPPVQTVRTYEGLWTVLNQGQVVGLVPFSACDLGALELDLVFGLSL